MADNKRGRDKQARDAERRQQKREVATALARGDEAEPPVAAPDLADVEAELDAVSFPATGSDIVDALGEREIETEEGRFSLADLLPETDAETFDAPDAVRAQIERPSVAAAMKRVIDASDTLENPELRWSQRKAYEKTFVELGAIDVEDDDDGITVITDWIVERIHEKEKLPSSRGVRREAGKFARSQGQQVRNDEWLGI